MVGSTAVVQGTNYDRVSAAALSEGGIHQASKPAAPPTRAAVLLLLLTAASIEWGGYRFGISNQSIQVPILKHEMDASLYPGDPLFTAVKGYTTFFVPILAAAVRTFGHLEAVYFTAYVIVHFIALAGVCALSWRLFRNRAAATLACLLYLTNAVSLAGQGLFSRFLQHGHVASALLLWALWLYLGNRPLVAFALCGLAFDIHALQASYVLSLMGFDWLLGERTRGLGARLLPFAMFAVTAFPTLAWLRMNREPIPPGSLEAWLAIMRERSAIHAFPFSMPIAGYGEYALALGLGALALSTLVGHPLRESLLRFGAAIALLCAVGVVFAEWVPVPVVIQAQLLRCTAWLTLFILLLLARLLVGSWTAGVVSRFAVAAIIAGFLLSTPLLFAAGISLLLVGRGQRWSVLQAAVALSALVLTAVTRAAWPARELLPNALLGAAERLLSTPGALVCVVLAGCVLLAGRAMPSFQRWVEVAAAAVTIMAVLPASYLRTKRDLHDEPWTKVQEWVRDHTEREATLLTPPYHEGFRVFSERAIVGEWKDGTQQFFSATFGVEWLRRMKELHGKTRDYDDFGFPALRELAQEYDADYVVAHSSHDNSRTAERPLPKVYDDGVFVVYKIGPIQPPQAP
jgi:hypothetical protein